MSSKRAKFDKKKWRKDNYNKKKLAKLSPKSRRRFRRNRQRESETPQQRETRLVKHREEQAASQRRTKANRQPKLLGIMSSSSDNDPQISTMSLAERHRMLNDELFRHRQHSTAKREDECRRTRESNQAVVNAGIEGNNALRRIQ